MILLLRSSMLQIFLSVCANFFTEQISLWTHQSGASMQVTNYLLQNFDCSARGFQSGLSLTAHGVNLETELRLQFPNTQDLDAIRLADQSVNIQIFRGEIGDTVFFSNQVKLTEIEHFVFLAMNILETTLGNPALNGHLTTFMGHFPLITCTALTTLVTLG